MPGEGMVIPGPMSVYPWYTCPCHPLVWFRDWFRKWFGIGLENGLENSLGNGNGFGNGSGNGFGNGSEIASGNVLGNCLGNGLGIDLNGVEPMQQIDHTHQMQQLDLNGGGNSVLSAKRYPMW